jgi:hypothetical protein
LVIDVIDRKIKPIIELEALIAWCAVVEIGVSLLFSSMANNRLIYIRYGGNQPVLVETHYDGGQESKGHS